jgi:hypothetical protein
MASITTRQTGTTGTGGVTRKDAPLTNAEIDNNFISLNTAKVEISDTTENNVTGSVVRRNSSTGGFTAGSSQFTSLGVGVAPSGTTGEIRASNSVTSWYSDERLKENIKPIENALDKVLSIRGVTFQPNSLAESFGYKKQNEVGVIAQEVEKILPEAVKAAPFDLIQLNEGIDISRSGENYKTVQYEKLVPLLIEAIKELNKEIEIIKGSK